MWLQKGWGMLLTIDIGNTNTVLGIFDGDRVIEHWRIATIPDRTADELAVVLHGLLAGTGALTEAESPAPPADGGPAVR